MGGRARGRHARNSKYPGRAGILAEPGTAAQMASTSAVGPPMSVVPVSIAASAAAPVATDTLAPCTVISAGAM